MTRHFLAAALCAGLLAGVSAAAQAAALRYYPDPVYKRLNAADPPPMEDMIGLAGQGDVRAQFILGDLYAKGKGGMAKDPAEARHWFEESAIHGYEYSFLRLAALAKRAGKPLEAWQWYSLAIHAFDYGAARDFAIAARRGLTESAGLSREDIRQARKPMSDWEDARDKRLSDEKKAASGEKNRKTMTAGAITNEQNKSQNATR